MPINFYLRRALSLEQETPCGFRGFSPGPMDWLGDLCKATVYGLGESRVGLAVYIS